MVIYLRPEYNGKILVVDDDEPLRLLCTQALRTLFSEVDCAGSAEEAMKNIEEKDYDVVVLDIMLPGIPGNIFINEIKKKYPLTEVIMITGVPSIAMSTQTLKNGAFDFIAKPFKVKQLKDVVNDAIDKRKKNIEQLLEKEWVLKTY